MKNIISIAVTEALSTRSDQDDANVLRLKTLLTRLMQDLPSEEGYLEVGALDVGYFGSALQGQKAVRAYAAITETLLKDEEPPAFKAAVEGNGEQHSKCKFFGGEFFRIIKEKDPFPTPVGIYFYAGATFQSRLRAAVGRARPFLAPQAILICDNWKLSSVRHGAWEGVASLRPWKVAFRELRGEDPADPEGFGEGVGIFYVELS